MMQNAEPSCFWVGVSSLAPEQATKGNALIRSDPGKAKQYLANPERDAFAFIVGRQSLAAITTRRPLHKPARGPRALQFFS